MDTKTIILINDNTAEAEHAALLALKIAERENARIVLANESAWMAVSPALFDLAAVGLESISGEHEATSLPDKLRDSSNSENGQKIEIAEIDISAFSVEDLSRFIIKNNIWMIVKGSADISTDNTEGLHLHIQYVLNRVMCPLLLVPHCFALKDIERIVYVADLRYCRMPVVRYLADLARPYNATVYIDHLSAKGLPHMDEAYANSFFEQEIAAKTPYDGLFFNNIRERDVNKAVDVMISGLHADILAFVNHRFHFEQILGNMIPDHLPDQITVPLLIFPY